MADIKTEAVFVCQYLGNVGRENMQQLMDSLDSSAWKTVTSLTSEGSIQCVSAGSKILICPLASHMLYSVKRWSEALWSDQSTKQTCVAKRSVTILTFPHTSRGRFSTHSCFSDDSFILKREATCLHSYAVSCFL